MWRLQGAFVEHQRALLAGLGPRRVFHGRHAQAASRLGSAVGELLIVAFEQRWQMHRLMLLRYVACIITPAFCTLVGMLCCDLLCVELQHEC